MTDRPIIFSPSMVLALLAGRGFVNLWESLRGPGSWEVNPEVVALSFTVEKRDTV